MPAEASPAAVTSPNEPGPGRRAAAAVARSERLHAGALAALIVAALLLFTNLKTAGTAAFADPGWDRHLYIEMARTNPLDFHLAPFGWRVLVPSLAALSPFSLQASFLAITVVAAWAIGPVLHELFRAARFSHTWALIGVAIFYTVGWATRFQLADFWIPDATAFLFVASGLLLAARRRPVPFAAVLVFGVLAKESVIVVAPMFYALNARSPREFRLLAVSVAVVAPAAVALVALRLLIPAYNGDPAYIASLPERISRFPELFPPYNYFALLREIGYERRYQARDLDTFVSYSSGTFGAALFALALASLKRHWQLALRLSPFIVLVYLQLLVATDTERLVALAAIPHHLARPRRGPRPLVLLRPARGLVPAAAACVARRATERRGSVRASPPTRGSRCGRDRRHSLAAGGPPAPGPALPAHAGARGRLRDSPPPRRRPSDRAATARSSGAHGDG